MLQHHGVVRIALRNGERRPRRLIIEPWASEFTLRPGQAYVIHAEGDLSLPFRVELTDDGVTLSSFDSGGALVTVFEDGREVLPEPGASL